MTHPSRAWIVGGAGLIGAALVEQLQERGVEVLVTDSLRALRGADPRTRPLAEAALSRLRRLVPVAEVDVRDDQGMQSAARDARPDVVVWLAALLASESRQDPAEATAVQVEAFDRFLQRGAAGAARVVLASSSYVYGHFSTSNATEAHATNPIDPYGRTKLEAEGLLAAVRSRLQISTCVVRPSAVYGPGDPRPRFASLAVESAVSGLPVPVDDWDFISDFTFVDDAAAGFSLAATHPAPPPCMNVSFGRAHTNLDFGQVLAERLQTTLEVSPSTWRETGYVPARGALDIRAARSIGYQPRFDLRAGIEEFLVRREQLLS